MANRDKITGAWSADGTDGVIGGIDGDMLLSFNGTKIKGEYDYTKIRLGGNSIAKVYAQKKDDGGIGWKSYSTKKIGAFKAKTDFVIDLPPISTGKFVVNENSGRFKLFYEGEMYATGRLSDLDVFSKPNWFL